jgi:hypothetical protein
MTEATATIAEHRAILAAGGLGMLEDAIELQWRGPLRWGSLPRSNPEVSDLKIAAVYIFFRYYVDGTMLVYVGKAEKSNPLINRIATWYSDFISGKVGELFQEDGKVFRPGGLDHFFKSLQDDFEETLLHSKAEALRTRFIYTPIQDGITLSTVETTILSRLKKNLPSARFRIWNDQYRGTPSAFPFQHDLSVLKIDLLTPDESSGLQMVLLACEKA